MTRERRQSRSVLGRGTGVSGPARTVGDPRDLDKRLICFLIYPYLHIKRRMKQGRYGVTFLIYSKAP